MNIREENARQIKTMRKNFKILREQQKWSIKELSELSGISEIVLMKIESGEDFGIIYLFQLCDIYNIKPHKIFLDEK